MIQIIKIEKISTAKICSLNPFMTEAVSKSMDWFLYDNGLRHDRVKYSYQNGYVKSSSSISDFQKTCIQGLPDYT